MVIESITSGIGLLSSISLLSATSVAMAVKGGDDVDKTGEPLDAFIAVESDPRASFQYAMQEGLRDVTAAGKGGWFQWSREARQRTAFHQLLERAQSELKKSPSLEAAKAHIAAIPLLVSFVEKMRWESYFDYHGSPYIWLKGFVGAPDTEISLFTGFSPLTAPAVDSAVKPDPSLVNIGGFLGPPMSGMDVFHSFRDTFRENNPNLFVSDPGAEKHYDFLRAVFPAGENMEKIIRDIREWMEAPLRNHTVWWREGYPRSKGVLLYGSDVIDGSAIAQAVALASGADFVDMNDPQFAALLQAKIRSETKVVLYVGSLAARAPEWSLSLEKIMDYFNDEKAQFPVLFVGTAHAWNVVPPLLRRQMYFDLGIRL